MTLRLESTVLANLITCSCLLGKMTLAWNACTISKASHKVPEPLRNTYITKPWKATMLKSFLNGETNTIAKEES